MWVRLGFVTEIARGGSPRPIKAFLTTKGNGIPWIKIGDSDKGGKYINSTEEFIIKDAVSKSRMVHKGDFLLTNSMSFGRPYILNIGGCIHDGWLVISNIYNVFNVEYLYYLLSSRFAYYQFCKTVSGAVVKNLNTEKVADSIVPLPPLSEQKRIVAKIEELLPHIEEYGRCEAELNKLNKDFPEALKKSILQTAVQGRLVPQDPNDESAEKLLEKIRAERQKLIKEGKIKKSKTESQIFRRGSAYYEKCGAEEKCIDSELPFEIPDSWRWVRLGNITHINPRNLIDDNLEVSFIPMNFIEDGYSNKHSYSVRKWKEIKNGFTHFCDGDIGIAKITPCFENRKSVIFKDLKNKHGAGTTELHIIRSLSAMLYSKYLLYFFKSEFFISNGIKSYTGTAGQQRISKEFVSKYLFPFPPLEEQKRIVAKIEELLAIIDSMKK